MKGNLRQLIVILFLFSGGASAVPADVVVDNSQLATGRLTITGTGFGATGAEVIMYDRFESDTAKAGDIVPLAASDIGAWNAYGGSTGQFPPLYNTLAHSGRFGMQTFTTEMHQLKLDFPRGIQEIFISYWVRLPEGQIFPGRDFPEGKKAETFASDSSWKLTWLYDRDVQGKSNDVCLPTAVGGGVFYLGGNDIPNIDTKIGSFDTWWSWKTWMRIGVWLKANPVDVTAPGDVLFQTVSAEKGVREHRSMNPIFDGDYANGPDELNEGFPNVQEYKHINFPGWYRPETTVGTTPIYDDIYVAIGANSQARVELADSADYMKAKRVAIQKVVSWSDSAIVIDIIEGELDKELKKAAFVFVTDKDGNRNAVGIPVRRYPKPPATN